MSFDLNDPRVPRWIQENHRSGRWFSNPQPHPSPNGILADTQGRTRPLSGQEFARAARGGGVCYLFDGPTFPVADGGSTVKVGLIQALIASNLGVFGIAANWGWEAVNDYGSNLSIPIAWLPPEEYFAGDSIVGLVQASGAGMVIGDSLETLSRLTHLKLPTVLLLFDFYPQLWAQLGAVPAEIDRALQMLRSLDPRTTTVLTRCADDARRLGEVVSLRTVVFDGVDVSDVGGGIGLQGGRACCMPWELSLSPELRRAGAVGRMLDCRSAASGRWESSPRSRS